jgi:tRNA(His) 5'-end guanylyltransferase
MKPPKEYSDAFQKLVQSNEQVHFNIRVSGTKFSNVTANTYNLKKFYDSAIKEGAFECAENQTIND